MRVLVVDDAMFMRRMLSDILEKGGHIVCGEAATGKEAVDRYKELKPDLVTMDIIMPDMSGIEAVKEIRKSDSEAKIQKAVLEFSRGRTCFIIAHRLSTIVNADRIVVLDKGTIVAHGKHEQLMETCPLYRKLYEIQFAGTDTLRIAVPAAVSDRLQIEGDGIREKRKAELGADDGATDDGSNEGGPSEDMVQWTVLLHSEASGSRTFTATYDRRISIPDEGTQFELQPIKALDADRETGEIAIQKDRALWIEAAPTGLETSSCTRAIAARAWEAAISAGGSRGPAVGGGSTTSRPWKRARDARS